MVKYKIFDNGLKLIVKKIDGLLSVSTGIMVGAGSIDENDENNGISHFIEHMMFKGTKKRTSFEISDSIDKVGAQINAFTTKETTCYYTKSTVEHFEKTLEILSDLFFNSIYSKEEMVREKGVILEEISMSNDTPDDLCIEYLAAAFYGKEGLGRAILGSSKNVRSFTKKDIVNYMKQNYYPENVVISVAGNVDFEKVEKLAEKYFAKNFNVNNTNKPEPIKDSIFTNHLSKKKNIEQLHIGLAFPSIKTDDPMTNALAISNIVLGGGMSSRLFQKIREELGLAYTVFSYLSAYRNSGIMTVYAGINPKNKQIAVDSIIKLLTTFKKDKITKDEFLRGKEQMKSAFILGQESTASQMLLYGKYFLISNKIFDFEKKIEEIGNVTIEDVNDAIDISFDIDKMASSCVGKNAVKLF
jgi:predicted Zn-dependent peptidase